MKVTKIWKQLCFKWKLLFSYFLIILMVSISIFIFSYFFSAKQVVEIAKKMASEILDKDMEILDEHIDKIEDYVFQIATDKRLVSYIEKEKNDDFNFLEADRGIKVILSSYFSEEGIEAVSLITEKNLYGNNINFLTAEKFRNSELFAEVLKKSGEIVWTSYYDTVDMYNLGEYRDIKFENRWLLSAARCFGKGYVDEKGKFISFHLEDNRPVLLINFSKNFIEKILKSSMPVQGTELYLLSEQGEEIYSEGGGRTKEDLLEICRHISGKNGTDIIVAGGRNTAISYVTSDITKWRLVAVMPQDELMSSFQNKLLLASSIVAGVAVIFGILLSVVFATSISQNVRQIVKAMENVGDGDFSTKLQAEQKDEFGYLIAGFNNMNQKIMELIEAEYASKLREKEMEIIALNMQLNPHFLYNTLTVLNYEAINSGCDRVGEMLSNLCEMLNYTFGNRKTTVVFREDLQWLKNYVSIMQYRFVNRFAVSFDVEEELLDAYIPKLLLQPFVENSIIHGFSHLSSKGMITVTGIRKENRCVFEIWDNGVGDDCIEEKLEKEHAVGSIGISNIRERIRLMYGDDYGVQIVSKSGEGTRVIINLPYIV